MTEIGVKWTSKPGSHAQFKVIVDMHTDTHRTNCSTCTQVAIRTRVGLECYGRTAVLQQLMVALLDYRLAVLGLSLILVPTAHRKPHVWIARCKIEIDADLLTFRPVISGDAVSRVLVAETDSCGIARPTAVSLVTSTMTTASSLFSLPFPRSPADVRRYGWMMNDLHICLLSSDMSLASCIRPPSSSLTVATARQICSHENSAVLLARRSLSIARKLELSHLSVGPESVLWQNG